MTAHRKEEGPDAGPQATRRSTAYLATPATSSALPAKRGMTRTIGERGRKRKLGKGRQGKGREGKGREGKGREGKGREGKGRNSKKGKRRYTI